MSTSCTTFSKKILNVVMGAAQTNRKKQDRLNQDQNLEDETRDYSIKTPYYIYDEIPVPKIKFQDAKLKQSTLFPKELFSLIFTFVVDPRNIFKLGSVCRLWYNLTTEVRFPYLFTGKKSMAFPSTYSKLLNRGYNYYPKSNDSKIQELKIVIDGNGGVGKSTTTVQFVCGIFVEKYDPTIEDSYRKNVSLPNKVKGKRGQKAEMNLMYEILDTASTEQFTAMRELYCKNGKVFIVIYSVTAKSTFENTTTVINFIKRIKKDDPNYLIILVGNKIDVPRESREVTYLEGLTKAHEFDVPFIETSAKMRHNTEELFEMIGELALCIQKPPKQSTIFS